MARKKIRECTAKSLLKRHHALLPAAFGSVQITAESNWEQLIILHPWLGTSRLVVKPDMLFGQRGKHDLVGLNLTAAEAEQFVKERVGRVITVENHGTNTSVTDSVTHFICERFVPHTEEYYLSIQSHREHTAIALSHKGGIHIEENWSLVREFNVEVGDMPVRPVDYDMAALFGSAAIADAVWDFVVESFRVFEKLDFTMMEFNPFVVVEDSGKLLCLPLDMRGELDDQAVFKNQKVWDGLDQFPRVFGHENSKEEDFIASLDAATGASLKLTLINPAGKIWLLVAGGGASVIFTDTVCDLGHSHDLGNYGEYSGNPSDDDTYQYTRTVLTLATRLDDVNPHKGRCLLIGGGIANFTDVKATFRGICKALLEFGEPLRQAGFKIFVRRGGPNYEAALRMMKEIEAGIGVPIEVYGPETHMTSIVHLAVDYVDKY
jgi:ATP citrate (pro-S)-lyase